MYVGLGATGNTGSMAARKLLERGEKVRAVGRDAGKLAQFFPVGGSSVVKSGAEPGTGADAGSRVQTAVGDASDAAALTRTVEAATATYVLLERGEKVRAVGRDAGKLAQFFPVGGSSVVKSGAEPGTGADAGSQKETAVDRK